MRPRLAAGSPRRHSFQRHIDAILAEQTIQRLDPEPSRCDHGHVNQPTKDELSDDGTASMKLTTTAQVSVDGVMQGPGRPQEDERGRLERGGWAHFDDEASALMDQIYQRAEAFLFGRRTYEVSLALGEPGTLRAPWADLDNVQHQAQVRDIEDAH
jgi:hypothetical protein